MYYDCLGNELHPLDIMIKNKWFMGVIKGFNNSITLQYYPFSSNGVWRLKFDLTGEKPTYGTKNTPFVPTIGTINNFSRDVLKINESILTGESLNYYKQMKKLLYGDTKDR